MALDQVVHSTLVANLCALEQCPFDFRAQQGFLARFVAVPPPINVGIVHGASFLGSADLHRACHDKLCD